MVDPAPFYEVDIFACRLRASLIRVLQQNRSEAVIPFANVGVGLLTDSIRSFRGRIWKELPQNRPKRVAQNANIYAVLQPLGGTDC